MDELLGDFIAETRETLEPLAGEIVAWEHDPSDRARLDAIFRFVHTVKGSCGFLDLPRLERLSHAAESALAAVRSGERVADRHLVDAVLAILDRIGALVDALERGEEYPEDGDEALILALEMREEAEPREISASTAAQAPLALRAPVRSIRLPVDLLDRMMAGVSDMVLARNELARRLRERGGDASVDTAFERLSACVAEMRESITRTRMQRVDGLFSALPRMVRDLSMELGKQVNLLVDGGDVELDREMIEMIRDPLTHIVRNAIDHGIETPADRAVAGKPMIGTLRVQARQSGNQILIEIADDGRGIDDAGLAEKAVAAGVVTRERAERMVRQERLELIFAPGLSTARAVTAISGRGVGMDVVRANVERIGGTVDVDTHAGRGCRLTLCVPMTLTIIPALTFAVGSELFAVPRGAVDEIVRSYGGSVEVETVGSAPVARIRGERVPVVELGKVLGIASHVPTDRSILIVVRASSGERYAMAVDNVQDHDELVVKPAAPAIMATGVYAGTTLPDNGRPMLLINPAGVAQVAGVRTPDAGVSTTAEEKDRGHGQTVPTLLFRALGGAVRAIRLSLVERIEEVPATAISRIGGQRRLTHDGRILPLFGDEGADHAPEARDIVRVLLLGDGEKEIGYLISEVVDIHDLAPDIVPNAEPGPIAGVMLVGDIGVELIDGFWLFERAGLGRSAADRPVCLVDGDDAWMRDVLRPIIEQAGYRVAYGDDPEAAEAAVAVFSIDRTPEDGRISAPVIALRPTPDQSPGRDGSVYRYDRMGLISALAAARGGC